MKWDLSEVDKYEEMKEYIDTALIPLLSIGMGEQLRLRLANASWLTGLVQIAEEQLVGRVMLFPPLSYVHEESEEVLSTLIQKQDIYLRQQGFKYVIFVTNDSSVGENLELEKLYIEALTSENLDFTKNTLIKEGYDLVPKITSFWKKG